MFKYLILVLLISIEAPLFAQPSTESQNAPKLTEGLTWSYRIKDMFTGNEVGQRTVRITKAADDGYDADIVNSGQKRSEFIDIDLNIKRNVDGNQFLSGDYSWPLIIGRKWNSVTWYLSTDGTLQKLEHTREIVSTEKVKVPAGEFDTYKIVAKGSWTIVKNPRGWNDRYGRSDYTYWYAPLAKGNVAFEYRNWAKGHTPPWEKMELLEYTQ